MFLISISIITNTVLLIMLIRKHLKCNILANLIKEQKIKQAIIVEFAESLSSKSKQISQPKRKTSSQIKND